MKPSEVMLMASECVWCQVGGGWRKARRPSLHTAAVPLWNVNGARRQLFRALIPLAVGEDPGVGEARGARRLSMI